MNNRRHQPAVEHTPRVLRIAAPALPSIVRYVDDFTDEDHSVSDPSALTWQVSINGASARIRFDRYMQDSALRRLIQAFASDLTTRRAVNTVRLYVDSLANVDMNDIIDLVECLPDRARPAWDQIKAKITRPEPLIALKALLKFVAERNVGAWTPVYLSFIASSLPLPTRDKFIGVRSGDVFISVADETALIRWIEAQSNAAAALSLVDLIDAALIICSYQFAMRPKQIGALRRRDCRVLVTATGDHTVHLTFRMIKQHSSVSKRMPLVRRVKREWAQVFSEICKLTEGKDGNAHLFGFRSASEISRRLRTLLADITQCNWTATDLRHSGAMRLVDAGASSEELAEFMGHSSLETSLVYYGASATQAERVNQALGVSETYREVARLGSTRFVSTDELLKLKGEEQVAGVPHGIPIAGIGACQSGQPSCPFNPVIACYGCPRFLPVANLAIHTDVLSSFRGVVSFFYTTSRGEPDTPAYLQLKRTISEVQSVIAELEASCDD